MLSEKYCRSLETSICMNKKQIHKLQSDKFIMQLLVGVGWSLFLNFVM
ncbi:MAG: hypothetical protein ACI8WB_004607 [Phenylobacterium sp.]|jgi:hypothetical protein